MENSIIEIKQELIEWIKNLDDLETLQKFVDFKNSAEPSSLISDINSETVIGNDFDQQFAAGMTSDELMENIAAHIGSIASEESSTGVAEEKTEYAVKDDFDERFAKGMTSKEFRKRIIQHIDSLPWEK